MTEKRKRGRPRKTAVKATKVEEKVEVVEQCSTCKYLRGAECRRKPPQVVVNGIGRVSDAAWPPVPDTGWCAEWVGRE